MTELDDATKEAFLHHLLTDGGPALDAHIHAGGTTTSYLTRWAIDHAARNLHITPELAQRILALPVRRDGDNCTVRTYLLALLAQVWTDTATYGICGNSDWRYDIYESLLEAGLIVSWRDGYGLGYRPDGTEHPEDRKAADRLVAAAIAALGGTSA